VGLERGPLSLVSTTEELLDRKVAAPVYNTVNTVIGIRHADHVAPSISKKLAITSSTGGGRSVGIVRSRTQTMEFFFIYKFGFRTVNTVQIIQLCCTELVSFQGLKHAVSKAYSVFENNLSRCLDWVELDCIHSEPLLLQKRNLMRTYFPHARKFSESYVLKTSHGWKFRANYHCYAGLSISYDKDESCTVFIALNCEHVLYNENKAQRL
jgi:hypothetical protein